MSQISLTPHIPVKKFKMHDFLLDKLVRRDPKAISPGYLPKFIESVSKFAIIGFYLKKNVCLKKPKSTLSFGKRVLLLLILSLLPKTILLGLNSYPGHSYLLLRNNKNYFLIKKRKKCRSERKKLLKQTKTKEIQINK